MIKKFEETGSVLDARAGKAGRPATVSTPETQERVQELMSSKTSTSVRRAAQQLGLNRETFRKICRPIKALPIQNPDGLATLSTQYHSENRFRQVNALSLRKR